MPILRLRHLPQNLPAIQQTLPLQPAGTWGSAAGKEPGLPCSPQARAAKAGMEGGSPEGHRTHAMCQPPTEP